MAVVTGWSKDGASISEISVGVGETVTVNANLGKEFEYFRDTMSTADTSVATVSWAGSGSGWTAVVTITGVSAGTTETALIGGYDTQDSPLTITVLSAEDESYLNKRGLAHFWENVDDIKQNKLTAGAGISITNDVISATGGGTADAVDWGHITGSMSNQTDLTTALNAKANTADLEEAVRQLQTGMENAISMVQQDYGIPHYSLFDLPDGTSWNSTTSDNFSVIGVDSPLDLFQGQCPPFVLNCSQLGSYTDGDGGETTVYNILMESGQLFVDEALVEMFIGETFIPSKDDISRGTQFTVIIQRDEDEEVVLRTRARTIYL